MNRLHDLFHRHEIVEANGSETAAEYLQQISRLVDETGIAHDLGIKEMNTEAMEKIHLYLHEIDTNSLPYRLHTYGRSYAADAAATTVRLIMKQNPDADENRVRRDLDASVEQELDNMIHALNGAYVPAGEGNDPLRNLAALPTGRNFYGFSPAKVPSKAAWKIGKRAAEQMIAARLKKDGTYPNKVGVVLWATETTRNEGVNESTILFLYAFFPDTPKSAVLMLYQAFVLINLVTMAVIGLYRKARAIPPESILGGAMLLIACYFMASVTVMPQFADVDKVYRLAVYEGKTPSQKLLHLLPFSVVGAAAFIGGYGLTSKKIRR